VCAAVAVQTGFGRLGGAGLWGFLQAGVVPDIVVLGKPVGNGFPLGVCVTTPAIAAAFDGGLEFFSTFGGSPVAAAAGRGVLRVLREEGLQGNAEAVGGVLLARLRGLQARFPLIGDVRGQGLFLGVELVHCRATLEPACASALALRLRDKGVLAGTEGPHNNVLKLRPPLCFTAQQAELVARALEEVLQEDAFQPRPGSSGSSSGSASAAATSGAGAGAGTGGSAAGQVGRSLVGAVSAWAQAHPLAVLTSVALVAVPLLLRARAWRLRDLRDSIWGVVSI
jgi:hypothetical protein